MIDTVGVKTDRPYAMIDLFGTPYTKTLHIVERYRLREYDDVKNAPESDPNYHGPKVGGLPKTIIDDFKAMGGRAGRGRARG